MGQINMYQVVLDVILRGGYNLQDILKKIARMWVLGYITEEQMTALETKANEEADPSAQYAEVQTQLNALSEEMEELTGRVTQLEKQVEQLATGGDAEPPEESEGPETEEILPWEPWGGVGKIPWQDGVKCTHNGFIWLSHVDNNVWEPGALGVYENIWEKIEEV